MSKVVRDKTDLWWGQVRYIDPKDRKTLIGEHIFVKADDILEARAKMLTIFQTEYPSITQYGMYDSVLQVAGPYRVEVSGIEKS